jgi:hypothetical protein
MESAPTIAWNERPRSPEYAIVYGNGTTRMFNAFPPSCADEALRSHDTAAELRGASSARLWLRVRMVQPTRGARDFGTTRAT